MPRDDDKSPLSNRLFWPRPGGRDLSAEVDYDRPCQVCGYNLRGMPLRSRCPECGSLGGWNLDDEEIAWDEHQSLWAFITTTSIAIFHPHLLARHLCRPARMDLGAARKYRRIAVAIAGVSLGAVAFLVTQSVCNTTMAVASFPFQLLSILVWLNATTLEPLIRLKDWSGSSAIARRVQALVHYLAAPLVISPLHIAIFFGLHGLAGDLEPWFVVPLVCMMLIGVQLLLSSIALGWMHYELIEIPKLQAQGMALSWLMTSLTTAVVMLIGIPALAALLASQLVGR